MKIAIIDYGAGNIKSVQFALERLGYEGICTSDSAVIQSADKVIFPGVGEASNAMSALKKNKLDKLIPTLKQPTLGVCLGMQLMCDFSEENGTKCLGIFPERVEKFEGEMKIPHMGWNQIFEYKSLIFSGLPKKSDVYFVHSFYVPPSKFSACTAEYGSRFSAALQRDNFYGCQFHPEKSGSVGEQILKNFLNLKK